MKANGDACDHEGQDGSEEVAAASGRRQSSDSRQQWRMPAAKSTA